MQVAHTRIDAPAAPPPAVTAAPARPDESKAREEDDHTWRETVSGELLQLMSRWRKEDIDTLARMAKDTGNALKGVWSNLKDGVTRALGLPVVQENIPEDTRETLARVAEGVAYGVGFTASGVMGLAGVAKLRTGARKHDRQRILDGIVDLAAAATIAVSVAGLGTTAAVLGPVAAALAVGRGGYNAVAGYKGHAPRVELQGILDGTRSFGTFCKLMGAVAGPIGVVAAVAAPIAGLLQAGRGYYDLREGLREGSNKKEINGLSDLGMAVGTTLALTGVGTIPGIALTVVSAGVKVAYQFHEGSRTRLDKVLDKVEPGLGKAVERLDRAARPLAQKLEPVRKKVVDRLADRILPKTPEKPEAPASPATPQA